MPNDQEMNASLAFRKNEQSIRDGYVPEKYMRLLPYIPGEHILEIGSAEGVLALSLARLGKKSIIALERKKERHEAALKLRDEWFQRFRFDRHLKLVHIHGDICDNLDLLQGLVTLVAVRMIYYLGEELDAVFAEAAKQQVKNIVLCGNKNRATWWRAGVPNRNDRADNYYASHEGMTDLLLRHGYHIKTVVEEGDPIVVGVR